MSRPLLAGLAALAGAGGAWLSVHLYRVRGSFLTDDAYISFRYARRWAEGLGLTWNDGLWVEGFSNPLWTLTLGGLARLGPEPHVAALWLGWGLLLAVPLVLAVLAARLELGLLPALILLLGTGLDVGLATWSSSGLETAQTALLVALWLLAAADRSPSPARLAAFGLLTGALLLSRPEAPLWAGVAGLWLLAGRRASPGSLAIWGALAAAPALAYLGFRWTHYGRLLPNTFYAKVEWSSLALAHGAGTLLGWAITHAVPLLLAGAALWLGRGRRAGDPAGVGRLAGGCVAAQAGFLLAVGGDWMGHGRLLAPLLPAFSLWVALAAAGRGWPRPRGAWAGPWLAAGLALHLGLGYGLRDRLDNFVPAAEIVGRWLERVAAPTDRLATPAAGAIPYFSKLWTYDVHGLNHPAVEQWEAHRTRTWTLGHNRYDLERMFSIRPEWIVWSYRTSRNRRRMEKLQARNLEHRERLGFTDAFLAHPALRDYRIVDSLPRRVTRTLTVFRLRPRRAPAADGPEPHATPPPGPPRARAPRRSPTPRP